MYLLKTTLRFSSVHELNYKLNFRINQRLEVGRFVMSHPTGSEGVHLGGVRMTILKFSGNDTFPRNRSRKLPEAKQT